MVTTNHIQQMNRELAWVMMIRLKISLITTTTKFIQVNISNFFTQIVRPRFFLEGYFYSSAFVFHLDISQNGPDVIIFELYQGEEGCIIQFYKLFNL